MMVTHDSRVVVLIMRLMRFAGDDRGNRRGGKVQISQSSSFRQHKLRPPSIVNEGICRQWSLHHDFGEIANLQLTCEH